MEWFRRLISDVLFPEYNACHLCGRGLEQPCILCDRCLHALTARRYKARQMADSEPHPPLQVCLSAYPHRDSARELVHLLKYHSDCAAAELLGEAMSAALLSSPMRPAAINAVVPVPLHASRLEQRGYNQALLLAQAVCGHAGLSLMEDVLIRIQDTGTQLHRNRTERLKAMRHAFAVPSAKALRGQHLLLVDDVLTTGATAMSCAVTLLEAGAASVSLLTACRAEER